MPAVLSDGYRFTGSRVDFIPGSHRNSVQNDALRRNDDGLPLIECVRDSYLGFLGDVEPLEQSRVSGIKRNETNAEVRYGIEHGARAVECSIARTSNEFRLDRTLHE